MKRTLTAFAIIAALAGAQAANATTYTYADTALNWDTWHTSNNQEVDPLGHPNIASTTIVMNDAQLQKISFNYASPTTFSDASILKSGDLFLDANGDKTWDYVVKAIGSNLNSTSSVLGLYEINVALHAANTYALSSYAYVADNTDTFSTKTNFRAGIPVGLLSSVTAGQNAIGAVGYTANANGISFDFGTNSILNFESPFIIGYGVTCGNDVIYQAAPVPEPGTFALLGAGLLGLGLYARRKKQL